MKMRIIITMTPALKNMPRRTPSMSHCSTWVSAVTLSMMLW